jgi:hypothetical protein
LCPFLDLCVELAKRLPEKQRPEKFPDFGLNWEPLPSTKGFPACLADQSEGAIRKQSERQNADQSEIGTADQSEKSEAEQPQRGDSDQSDSDAADQSERGEPCQTAKCPADQLETCTVVHSDAYKQCKFDSILRGEIVASIKQPKTEEDFTPKRVKYDDQLFAESSLIKIYNVLTSESVIRAAVQELKVQQNSPDNR